MDRKILRKIVEDSASGQGVDVCEVRYSPRNGHIDVVCDKPGAKIEGKIVRVEKNNIFLEAPLEERVSVSEVETARVLI
ncbi:MAG: hypothetical protein ABIH68_05160 [bacterium]